jgi:ferredoxin
MERFCIIGSAFPEIKLSKSKYGSGLIYDITYSEQDIVISHGSNTFSSLSGKSVLDSALENDIELKYMCKSGICLKCRKKIISGACMELCEIEEGIMIRPEFLLTCNYKSITSLVIG